MRSGTAAIQLQSALVVAAAVGEHVVDRDIIGPPVGIAAQSQMRVRQVGAVQRRAGLEARAGNDRAGEMRPGGGLALCGLVGGLGKRQTRQDQGGGDDGQADHATGISLSGIDSPAELLGCSALSTYNNKSPCWLTAEDP
jgi:hypothetical protein